MSRIEQAPAEGCARCEAELEVGDLRCPVCALAVPAAPSRVAKPRARIVRCDTCGASLSWVAEAQAPKCAFCDSTMALEVQADPPEQAEHFLPFTVDPGEAKAALRRFLGRGNIFRPSDLAKEATLAHLQALWWPAWIFEARARVSWTADSEQGSGRAAWAPHAGAAPVRFQNVAVSASRGLSLDECFRLLPACDLSTRRPSPEGPEAAQVERFDVSRSGARKLIQEAIEREAAARVRPQVPGTAIRQIKTAVLLEGLRTSRYAFPAYVLAYRYGKALYRVVIHGQDANLVLGARPLSTWKLLGAVFGGMALALAALAWLSGAL